MPLFRKLMRFDKRRHCSGGNLFQQLRAEDKVFRELVAALKLLAALREVKTLANLCRVEEVPDNKAIQQDHC